MLFKKTNSVLVVYCCITNHLILKGFTQQSFDFFMILQSKLHLEKLFIWFLLGSLAAIIWRGEKVQYPKLSHPTC